jgi:glycosyltransferase involved in cell wall biosynthesis
LLSALAALRRQGLEFCAVLVGDGPGRGSLEQQVAMLELSQYVRFLGWRDDVPRLLDAADVFVLPSVAYECLPYAILEAMAHGLPVVATDLAGIPEAVVNGETGRVVPPADPLALSDALRDVLDLPDRGRSWGQAGLRRVASCFALDQMVEAVSDLWSEAARDARRPRPEERTG